MSQTQPLQRLLAVVVVVAGVLFVDASSSTAGWDGLSLLNQTGCSLCCPACNHVCRFKAEQVDVDKTCFEVEPKIICIPRVVFPWQKRAVANCGSCDGAGCTSCVHNGARTRSICVLKVKQYQCPACDYSWAPEPCASSCDDGCDTPACDATATPYLTDTPMKYLEPSPTRPLAVPSIPLRQPVTRIERLPRTVN